MLFLRQILFPYYNHQCIVQIMLSHSTARIKRKGSSQQILDGKTHLQNFILSTRRGCGTRKYALSLSFLRKRTGTSGQLYLKEGWVWIWNMLSLQRQHTLSAGWKYRLQPLHTQSSFRLEPCCPTEASARVRMFCVCTFQHGGHSLRVSARHLNCGWLINKLNSNQV